MNTKQITRAISGLKANSIGVYAADHIPRSLTLPGNVVTNVDTSDKPGSHWVAFYIDKNAKGTYFDSYGLAPVSGHHIDRLRRNCASFKQYKKKLQSVNSKVCGEYCIMFLCYMCSSRTLRAFCNIFSRDSHVNDALAAKFYENIKRKNHRKRLTRANNFPRSSSKGSGSFVQTCKAFILSVYVCVCVCVYVYVCVCNLAPHSIFQFLIFLFYPAIHSMFSL